MASLTMERDTSSRLLSPHGIHKTSIGPQAGWQQKDQGSLRGEVHVSFCTTCPHLPASQLRDKGPKGLPERSRKLGVFYGRHLAGMLLRPSANGHFLKGDWCCFLGPYLAGSYKRKTLKPMACQIITCASVHSSVRMCRPTH